MSARSSGSTRTSDIALSHLTLDPRREPSESARLRAATRLGMAVLAVGITVVFAVARWLEPEPSGLGTHRQLGLPECPFIRTIGKPCPSCGMTTAFAWFVRGRLDRSIRANPAGAWLAASCVALVPWLVIGAFLGKTPGFRSLEPPLIGLVAITLAVSLISWTIQMVRLS